MVQTELRREIRVRDVNLGVIFLQVMDEATGEKTKHYFLQVRRKNLSHFLRREKRRSLQQGGLIGHSVTHKTSHPHVACKAAVK